jgi:AAA15 family ATPase/GTPase
MYIKEFQIVNFKAFRDVHITFNSQVNILTGVNNSGKTTVLEALALWHECFSKLIMQAGRATKNYKKNDWVLGNTQVKYFPFDQINSVRCPNFEDLFHQRDRRNTIGLFANLENNEGEVINIGFWINESGMNYVIQLSDFSTYNFDLFNRFFKNFPIPIGFFYVSPIAAIQQIENFVTPPQVNDAIVNRSSASVLRNRLYTLYRNQDTSLFQRFLSDVSYVLYDNRQQLELSTTSDIQKDRSVVFNVKTHPGDMPKDVALLGSGTVQIIEILLNLYHSDNQAKDMTLILLDEPDSHIHRDIQGRLMRLLKQFSQNSQIFITTHNEALIRSAEVSHLFHLEPKSEGRYKNLDILPLEKVRPRFSGIYPSAISPVISAIGNANGIDFINAIEADLLLFVEGEDDARAFDILLRQQIRPKKTAYWVLGGVSKVFDNILHYKTVFTNIKNQRTLWEKSALIFDRDFLNDEHQQAAPALFQSKIGLKTHCIEAYTFEATLLTEIPKFARLLHKWLIAKGQDLNIEQLANLLAEFYYRLGAEKTAKWTSNAVIEETAYLYQNAREKLNALSGQKFISANDIQIQTLIRQHLDKCLSNGEYYKLMRKEDVQTIVNDSLSVTGIVFDIESDFIDLLCFVDKSLWFDAWDFLNTL